MKSVLYFGSLPFQVVLIVLFVLSIQPTGGDEALVALQRVPFGNNMSSGHSLQVGDAKIYYEIYGHGEPIVLLHGGLFGYIDEFGGIISDLSRNQRVIAIATRGHGKSELGTQPLSYRLFAEDFAAIIRNVTTRQVNVLGFSDGAIAGYHLAAAHPERVKKLIAVGGPLGFYGFTDSGVNDLDQYDTPEKLEKFAPGFVSNRKKLMPDPTVWNQFLKKLASMWKQREYISRQKVQSIRCPVLIAGGDRDEYVKTEHLVEIYRMLPKGQLAIVPNCPHTVFNSKPKLMLELIQEFLRNP